MPTNQQLPFTNRQPNSDHCFICGRKNPHGLYMSFYDDGDKTVASTHTVPEAYQGYPGVVHGGIVAAIAPHQHLTSPTGGLRGISTTITLS